MTITASAPAISASVPIADWFVPDSPDTRRTLDEVVLHPNTVDEKRARPLRMLSAIARRALIEEIESKLRMVMSETLADLIVGGWRTYGAVMRAAQKSADRPGVDHIVPLRSHTIKAAKQNSLDIEVDDVRVMTLNSQLLVSVQLSDAVIVVRNGHVVAIRSGRANVDGRLAVEGVEVSRRTLTFPLPAELVLRPLQGAAAVH